MALEQYYGLQKLQSIIEQLGYSVVLLSKSVDIPIDMLSVSIESDTQDVPIFLTISIYPLGDELDGSEFVQFYFQYPFEISSEHHSRILKELSAVNRELPLGHFNIAVDENRLYFKYVLALPQNLEVEPFLVNDVLDMCIYASEYCIEMLGSDIGHL